MATTYADHIAKGNVFWSTYVPGDLAARAERFILPNCRSEFVRRAIEREVERLEASDGANDPDADAVIDALLGRRSDGTD